MVELAKALREAHRNPHFKTLRRNLLLLGVPGLKHYINLHPDKNEDVVVDTFGDSMMIPDEEIPQSSDTHEPHSFDHFVVEAANKFSSIWRWRRKNIALPGLTSGEVAGRLEKHSDEFISQTGSVILAGDALGNDWRGLIEQDSDLEKVAALLRNPFKRESIGFFKKWKKTQRAFGENCQRIFEAADRIHSGRIKAHRSGLEAFVWFSAQDIGLARQIPFYPLEGSKAKVCDINLEDYSLAWLVAFLISVSVNFEGSRQLNRFLKEKKPSFKVLTVTMVGLEDYWPKDYHLGKDGHQKIAERVVERIDPLRNILQTK